jgi:hypothetical protein
MPRPKHAVAMEAGAVCLFLALTAASLYRLAVSLQDRWDLAWYPLAIPAGWLAADFASGIVHWFADTFFEEDAPWIGPLLIRPFREHHRDPQAMTRHGFLELTGNSCLVLLPVTTIDWLFGTLYLPGNRWPKTYGIEGNPVPERFSKQLVYPLK